jgi:hypothetical protein
VRLFQQKAKPMLAGSAVATNREGHRSPKLRRTGFVRKRAHRVRAFLAGQPALNLAAAWLRHIAGTAWSTKRYLNIGLLKEQQMRGASTA